MVGNAQVPGRIPFSEIIAWMDGEQITDPDDRDFCWSVLRAMDARAVHAEVKHADPEGVD